MENLVENLWIVLKKHVTDALEIASKRAILKTTEVAGDFERTGMTDKITSKSNNSLTPAQIKEFNESSLAMPKERYVSPETRRKIIDELRSI